MRSNVVWKTKLPNWSNASPILVGDRLFVCAEPSTLICLAAADGRILWQGANTYFDLLAPDQVAQARAEEKAAQALKGRVNELDKRLKEKSTALANSSNETDKVSLTQDVVRIRGEVEPLQKQLQPLADKWLPPDVHPINGYSSPTPTSDGRHVFVVFGTGVAACYDLEGHRRWARVVERPSIGWGHSASPLLVGDRLIVHLRSLTALDAATGSNVWQVASEPHWGSEVRARIGGADVVVTPSGDIVKVADGTVLARRLSNLD